MKAIIDADGSPVVKSAVSIAKENDIEVLIVKNYAHKIEDDYARVVTVDITSDSTDYYIVNHASRGDIVITQDYGLAAMALSKGAICINQNGLVISEKNIDGLLARRHVNREARMRDGNFTKFKKRSKDDDLKFEESFRKLLENTERLDRLHLIG